MTTYHIPANDPVLSPVDPLWFRQRMERYAQHFGRCSTRWERLLNRRKRFFRKYTNLAHLRATDRLVALVGMLAHSVAIAISGFFSGQASLMILGPIYPQGLPLLPLLLAFPVPLIGLSIFAVHAWQFPTQPHPIIPGRRSYRRSDLAQAVGLTVAYLLGLGFLCYEFWQKSAAFPELKFIAHWLLFAGLLEFLLGFKALQGWGLSLYHLRSRWFSVLSRHYEHRLVWHARRTAKTTDFYLKAEQIASLREDRYPHYELNTAVKGALAYHQNILRKTNQNK